MTEDSYFMQLAQKLGLCQTEQTGGTWLEENKTVVVVVVAMVAVPIMLFKTYCYFSNKDKNKMDGKRNEKIMQEDEKKDVKKITQEDDDKKRGKKIKQEDDRKSEQKIKHKDDHKNEKKFKQVLLKKNKERSKQKDDDDK